LLENSGRVSRFVVAVGREINIRPTGKAVNAPFEHSSGAVKASLANHLNGAMSVHGERLGHAAQKEAIKPTSAV
jgi:hypothetical protein